jgi:hypothetical protein
MNIPNYIGKNPEEIAALDCYDSASYLFRAMAWLDYHKRTNKFSSLLYACIEARQGIEYLLFELLVISTGADLSVEQYRKCVNEKNRFIKTIKQLTPDYELLQEFTKILASLEPSFPKLIYWDNAQLMKTWGVLSQYLHWFGARSLTTENPQELKLVSNLIENELNPVWIKITSGQSALMHPKDMVLVVYEIWDAFRMGKVSVESAKFQLDYLKPITQKYK